jgi:N-acetylneuraminic acid mutarotase
VKNKKHTTQSAFFNVRALVAFLICSAAACSILCGAVLAFVRPEAPANSSQRTLTFADRVAYQRAIEEVYWRHRIWPAANAGPKPPLDRVMPQEAIGKKVEDYLRYSQALEDYWQRPITAEQLQAEMERMAQNTKQPEVLRELFEALGNDPLVIAECLARPILSERLKAAAVERRNGALASSQSRAPAQATVTMPAVSANYTLPTIASPSGGCTDDTWTATSTTNAPDGREHHTAVWTGSEMIVWGGLDSSGPSYLNTGGRYDPSTDSWTATSTTNAPDGRLSHTAVWTGSEMIVWGGRNNTSPFYLNTGGRYNPSTDTWAATSTTGPDVRAFHTAAWTGSEMIVWGGYNNFAGVLNNGGRYNPSTNSWTGTSTTNAPDGRLYHTGVWTGSEMTVWGGCNGSVDNPCANVLNTGGRYSPSTDSWTATSLTNAPDARELHTAVWTGSQMIVWGGLAGVFNYLDTGGRYNPGTDSWRATSTTNAPDGREAPTAVWTDTEMIVWGGLGAGPAELNTGGRYNPGTDSWTATNTTNAPAARVSHTAVWTGSQMMIVWGGYSPPAGDLNTGGRYCAQSGPTPTPTPTPTATATFTPTPTATFTPTPTVTATATATATATFTPSVTPTPSEHPSPTPRPNLTPRTRPTPRPRP